MDKLYFSILNKENKKIYFGNSGHPAKYIEELFYRAKISRGKPVNVGEQMAALLQDMWLFPRESFEITVLPEKPIYQLHKYQTMDNIKVNETMCANGTEANINSWITFKNITNNKIYIGTSIEPIKYISKIINESIKYPAGKEGRSNGIQLLERDLAKYGKDKFDISISYKEPELEIHKYDYEINLRPIILSDSDISYNCSCL